MKVLCSLFEIPVTVHEDNQGAIALTFSPQIQPCTKNIVIKYHHLQGVVFNGDVDIQRIDTKEHIADIFMKPLDYELFVYLGCKINGW